MASAVNTFAVLTTQDKPLQIRQWADLPKDVLFCIVGYVDIKIDLPRVRGVCKSWRSALHPNELPTSEPHIIEVPSLEALEDGNDLPFFLVESRFYFISPVLSSESAGSSNGNYGGWIARMCETGIGLNRWHLLNPLKNNYINYKRNNIGYFYTDPPITGIINLLDFRVFELYRSLSLVNELDNYNAKDLSKKVVGGWDYTSSYHFAALVLLGCEGADGGKELLLWRLGDQQWSKIVDDTVLWILDIALHNGIFFIFDQLHGYQWRVRVLNPRNSSVLIESIINAPDILVHDQTRFMFGVDGVTSYGWNTFSLVPSKSKGCLYLVRYVTLTAYVQMETRYCSNMFVFLMKENEERKWQPVENLGDEFFFIGHGVAFALPSAAAQNLPQWKPNSICAFLYKAFFCFDGYSRSTKKPEGVECLEIVKYPSYNKFLYFFSMEEKEKGLIRVSQMPKEDEMLYTSLFFPPPSWVKWHCPVLDNVEVRLDGLQFHDLLLIIK